MNYSKDTANETLRTIVSALDQEIIDLSLYRAHKEMHAKGLTPEDVNPGYIKRLAGHQRIMITKKVLDTFVAGVERVLIDIGVCEEGDLGRAIGGEH